MKSSNQTLKEYGRGIIGGLLFSLPIVYTMEVWWSGFLSSPEKLLVFVLFTFLLLLGYNKFAGMREDASFLEVCRDSVEEIGLGFVTTFLFLLLIGRVEFGMSLYEIAGKTIMESMIVAIGISVGTAQMGAARSDEKGMTNDKEKEQKEKNSKSDNQYLELFILSVCGAVVVSSSVAPTDEILVIAVASSNMLLLLMVLLSLLISYITLFYSDFHGSLQKAVGVKKMSLHIFIGYLSALLVSVCLLWLFGRLAGFGMHIIIAEIVVLAIPASLGASAGRLLLRGRK